MVLIKLVFTCLPILKINVLLKTVHLHTGLIFIPSFSDVATRSTVQDARRVLFPALEFDLARRDRGHSTLVICKLFETQVGLSLLSCLM
jgi:hypothetical protein